MKMELSHSRDKGCLMQGAPAFLQLAILTIVMLTFSRTTAVWGGDACSMLGASEPLKDTWDYINIGSNILVGLVGVFLTLAAFYYNRRQRATEKKMRQIELAGQYLPHLLSYDDSKQWEMVQRIYSMGKRFENEHMRDFADAILGVVVVAPSPAPPREAATAEDVPRSPSFKWGEELEPLLATRAFSRPKGTVKYDDDPRKRHGPFTVTRGKHTLVLPESFRMGVYPVTNGLFREFIKDRGYENESLWDPTSSPYRSKFLCQDGKSPGPSTWPNSDDMAGGPKHPVAGISYFEAEAFCSWLKQTSAHAESWRWCLPTEDMWEFAARTTDGRDYPWGHRFKPDRCNSREADRHQVTDVTEFADGQSEHGCHDMAGNVWEYVRDTNAASWGCVLRGGSFKNNQDEIRSIFRLYRVPRHHRPLDFGFRVAQELRG